MTDPRKTKRYDIPNQQMTFLIYYLQVSCSSSNRYLKRTNRVNLCDADDAAQPAHGDAATLPDLAIAHHQYNLPAQHRIGRPLLKINYFLK